jgi:saccharopine dehydrogenase-like NADP-dependent oxidoreductase
VTSTVDLDAYVAVHDVVVSLIPYMYHVAVVKSAIKGKTNVVTTSYVSAELRALDAEVKKAGIVVMNEIGVDPGIDHLYAVKTISEVHEKGGRVRYPSLVLADSHHHPFRSGQAVFVVLWGPPCA